MPNVKRWASWLWPDHIIGKRESRRLREEHNALLNSHAEMYAALHGLRDWAIRLGGWDAPCWDVALEAMAKAQGGTDA